MGVVCVLGSFLLLPSSVCGLQEQINEFHLVCCTSGSSYHFYYQVHLAHREVLCARRTTH
jgi:hypothetical protein